MRFTLLIASTLAVVASARRAPSMPQPALKPRGRFGVPPVEPKKPVKAVKEVKHGMFSYMIDECCYLQ